MLIKLLPFDLITGEMPTKRSKEKPYMVHELCKALGRGSQQKDKKGVQSGLAFATSRFRHKFAIGTKFPIDFTDPIAKECALQFFDQDREENNFFHTNGVLGNSRFSSADDKDLYAPLPFLHLVLLL